jgi:hypothetical protein
MPPKESYELEFVHEAVHQQLSSALLISWPPMSHVSDIVDLVVAIGHLDTFWPFLIVVWPFSPHSRRFT